MLVKQFEKIHKEKKESIVIISHQERIINMADRIMVVKDGKIEKEGSKESVMQGLFMDNPVCGCMDEESCQSEGKASANNQRGLV